MARPLLLDWITKGPGLAARLPTDGLMGYSRRARLQTNDGLMMCRGVLSTPDVDKDRDVVVPQGGDLARHKLNPLVLLMHRPESPVGRAEHPRTKQYTTRLRDGRLVTDIYFAQNLEAGEQCYRLVKEGLLNGLSIGFWPKERAVTKGVGPDGEPIQVIGEWELVEQSLVAFPNNPHCVIEVAEVVAKGIGGRPLVPELREVLTPMLPILKVWSKGFGAGTLRKAYDAPADPDDPMNPAPLEDPADAPGPDADADAGPKMPAGAQALQGIHDWLTGHAEFVQDAAAVNEHPPVKKLIAKLQTTLAKLTSDVAGLFNSEYPDLPKLDAGDGGEAEPDAEPDGDEDPDATEGMSDDEESEYKSARRALRRLVTKAARKQLARRDLSAGARAEVTRIMERLASRPASAAAVRWGVKALRDALANPRGSGGAGTPVVAGPGVDPVVFGDDDLAAIEAAAGPLLARLDAVRADLGAITGR